MKFQPSHDEQEEQSTWNVRLIPNTVSSRNKRANGILGENQSWDNVKRKKRKRKTNITQEFDYNWDDDQEQPKIIANSRNLNSFQNLSRNSRVPYGASPYSDLKVEVL